MLEFDGLQFPVFRPVAFNDRVVSRRKLTGENASPRQSFAQWDAAWRESEAERHDLKRGITADGGAPAPWAYSLLCGIYGQRAGQVVVAKVDTVNMQLAGYVHVGGLPIDVKLAPDGSVFYVTNQGRMGVSVIDPVAMKEVQFIPTGRGAHGLQISRDTRSLYVSNRLEGSVSVVDFASRSVVAKWVMPGGGSPDMLQLSPDGSQLWASGRFSAQVYVFDTKAGTLLARINVGWEDHGLTYFPNVGLHSLGHNGVYR